MRPLILVTNDDGIDSPGLRAATAAALQLGEPLVVAPATQQTSMSRAFLTHDGVGAIDRHDLHVAGQVVPAYAVVGSPVMAVTHAVLELAERTPTLCISGINVGENIGGALGVSGTVSAALEAEVHGIPGLASSLQVDVAAWGTFPELDWTAATHFTAVLARQILDDGLPPEVAVLNLNVPHAATPATPIRRTVQSRQPYYVQRMPEGPRERRQPVRLSVHAVVDHDALEADSDIHAVTRDGVVSVTPLSWSMTATTDWLPRES